ncbi:5-demethoxyubiquinol-8 5-hydroxylase UbiM [Comamonas flocculans]|uniref:5-demethoxyubiquinol-8 5-hydroxylase UbiM n=1 Tax=Comamonas flocculans TaxID=2597701 RepID=A0A5B8RVU1_9BURK|nr:5-demethoxyubiquinol-8 5-hydroxylase UbiM [Comamonas flocculans]QEA12848.1 5-demethoxyubiquinol-8 5-hydroxylase UbiM [Comamonas flocculans]
MQHSDVLIVGAGPVGLTLSLALARAGFSSTVLEQQPAQALASPAFDGREIALTHPSRALLMQLGSWQRLAAHEVGLLREAQVHNAAVGRHRPMQLHAGGTGADNLGWIVPNHALRRSAWELASTTAGIELVTEARVQQVQTDAAQARVSFTQGERPFSVQAPLLVAADSRFSGVRRMLGIGASMHDFGRSVIVCRMRVEKDHGEITHECFDHHSTLAILPLPRGPEDGHPQVSAVVTVDGAQAQRLLELAPEDYAARIAAQFQHRLGAMQLVSERISYPLVAVWAHHFAGPRCALAGDAAVGTHPVTAHGFNIGLSGVRTLVQALSLARRRGLDIGSTWPLTRYERRHRLHAWPIFAGTNAIVRLYTDERPPARLLRRAVLSASQNFPPLKAAIVSQLTGRRPRWPRATPHA